MSYIVTSLSQVRENLKGKNRVSYGVQVGKYMYHWAIWKKRPSAWISTLECKEKIEPRLGVAANNKVQVLEETKKYWRKLGL